MSEMKAAVHIATPVHCNMHPETVLSMLKMNHLLQSQPPPGLEKFDFRYWRDSMLPRGRQGLLSEAFKAEATHIFWVDADMKFPPDTLHRLLAHDLPFVGANCVRRMDPYTWTAQNADGTEISSIGRRGVEKVGRLGFGITLMALACFEAIRPPFFNFEWIVDDEETGQGHYMGEDIFCCEKLAKAGIRPYVDHDLSMQIKHIGDVEVDYVFSEAFRQGSEE